MKAQLIPSTFDIESKFAVEGVIDVDHGDAYRDLSAEVPEGFQLPERFTDPRTRTALATIAMLYYHPAGTAVHTAMEKLAWYATEHDRIVLTKQDFRRYERQVKLYAERCKDLRPFNEMLARYVLRLAIGRAKSERLFASQ